MDCRIPQHDQQNPHTKTLLSKPANHVDQDHQKTAMEKFHQVIFKLAEAQPNEPLTPAFRTLLQDRLNQLGSLYKTPDHPPYSAMIEKALRELSEKRGSTEDSISQFLEKEYENLPLAHSMLLKHHLEKLCECGDIIVTRHNRYMLAGEENHNSLKSRAKGKKKRWRTKWRWDFEREKQRRQRKKQLLKPGNQKKSEKEKVKQTKKHQESENGVQHSEDKQVEEDQTKRSSLSFADGENCVAASNEKKHSVEVSLQHKETRPFEIMKPDTQAVQNQETGSFEIMKPDTQAVQNQETGPCETMKPDNGAAQILEMGPLEIIKPDTQAGQNQETGPFESLNPDNGAAQNQETGSFEIIKPDTRVVHNQETGPLEVTKPDTQAAQNQALGPLEIINKTEQSDHSQPELSSPKMPPGFESIRVEKLPHSGSRNPEVASSAEELSLESNRAKRQLRRWSTSSLKHPKAATMASPNLNTKIDSPNLLSLNSKQPEFHLSKEDEPQRKQLRRSLRTCKSEQEKIEEKPEKLQLPRMKTRFSLRHSKDEMKLSETDITTNSERPKKRRRPC